jgi:hypothetical protein
VEEEGREGEEVVKAAAEGEVEARVEGVEERRGLAAEAEGT